MNTDPNTPAGYSGRHAAVSLCRSLDPNRPCDLELVLKEGDRVVFRLNLDPRQRAELAAALTATLAHGAS